MNTALRVAEVLLGTMLVLVTLDSLVRTLVVPRGLSSRLTAWVQGGLNLGFQLVVRRLRDYETKDRLLAAEGPALLLALLTTWLVMLLTGFAGVLAGLGGDDFAGALRQSGSALFTLGFAPSTSVTVTVVSFFAAATGLVVVALQIAYLPTLYAAFNRRERLVTTLESRAGAPAWGPEILSRHQVVGITDNLPNFYDDWEKWAADVAESHTNYPVLVDFRSPTPRRSWLIGLLAVLDSAALQLALCPETAPSEARLCLRMGFTALREICSVRGIPFDADPLPDKPILLTYEEFLDGVRRLQESDFPLERSAEEAWPHFRGWRVNYEPMAYALADQINAVPGPWTGARSRMPGLLVTIQAPTNRAPGHPDGVRVAPRPDAPRLKRR